MTQVLHLVADKQMADELMACEAGKSRAEKIFEKNSKVFSEAADTVTTDRVHWHVAKSKPTRGF